MKIIIFTFDGISFPLAYKLIEEENDVVVAQIQNIEDLQCGDKPEDPETKKARLENYNGIFPKYDAKDVLRAMKNIKKKDEVFVFFDFNNLWKFADEVQKLGFTRGFFPSKEDYDLENDRNKAKDLVKKHYPDLEVAEVHEFKAIEEAKDFLEDQEGIFVLKGNSDLARTFVPSTKIPELAKIQVIEVLEEYSKDYEKDGFILEQLIIDPLELTPESLWWDGELIATSVDIENKPIGSGNLADQTGCSSCLVVETNPEDEINQIAFPDIVKEMASKHKGLFVWDASLYCKDGKYYFGEFCSCRFGWDSIFNEVMMAGSTTNFFRKIMEGKNPFKVKYGASVRGFIIPEKGKGSEYCIPVCSINWMEKTNDSTFLYDMKIDGERKVNLGLTTDLSIFAGASNNLYNAIDRAYEAVENFSYEDLYYRPKFDFTSLDYPSSILNRLYFGESSLFTQDLEDEVAEVKEVK